MKTSNTPSQLTNVRQRSLTNLSRKNNDTTKTQRKIKPPSTIIRNYRNQICHPLFTKKKLKLISIPMKTISYTYQCGHIRIIKYPPYQKEVAKKKLLPQKVAVDDTSLTSNVKNINNKQPPTTVMRYRRKQRKEK